MRTDRSHLSEPALGNRNLETRPTTNPLRRFYERLGGRFAGEKEIQIGEQTLTEVAYGWDDLGALEMDPVSVLSDFHRPVRQTARSVGKTDDSGVASFGFLGVQRACLLQSCRWTQVVLTTAIPRYNGGRFTTHICNFCLSPHHRH